MAERADPLRSDTPEPETTRMKGRPMTTIKKIVLCALALAALTGSAHAATPAPQPLSRADMTSIRGESVIDYGALNKNRVPCSKRGASYYNCQPGAQANPYTAGLQRHQPLRPH